MKKMKKKINKKEKKSWYSVLSNYHFIYSNLWSYDKSLIGYGTAQIIFSVIMPLGAVIAPAVVIGLLEKKVNIMVFIQSVAFVFLIYSLVAAVHSFLVSRNWYQYIDVRCNRFTFFLFRKCLHMDYHLYEDEKVREELEKAESSIFSNTVGIEGFMHHNISLFTNILGLIAYGVIISSISPVILLLLILISVIQLATFHKAKMYEHHKKDTLSEIKVTQSYLQEQAYDLKAGKDIRIYQLGNLIDRVYKTANLKLKKIRARIRSVYYLNDVVGIILRFFRDAVCYGYLIYLLIHGLDVSYFVLYLGIVSGLADWIMKITENISDISRSHLMICDLRKFLDIEDIFQHDRGKEINDEDSGIEVVFDHVFYRYNGAEKYVLEDISFHIGKGDRVALVGINGAGKTTIVKLMCGFYRPTQGNILINGVDISELNLENYFKQIAVVFQDAFTLSFTIGENICGTSSEEIQKDRLNNALELSGLKSKIDQLEKGIDTYLNKDMDEKGIQLSGGELQKLMLARALYKNARLLLLDEPTAALDAIAESKMYEQYEKLLQGRTSLFISHRLASTRFCNHIFFLENGKIVEEGTHEELMERRGEYFNMFEVQSSYYKEEKSSIKQEEKSSIKQEDCRDELQEGMA